MTYQEVYKKIHLLFIESKKEILNDPKVQSKVQTNIKSFTKKMNEDSINENFSKPILAGKMPTVGFKRMKEESTNMFTCILLYDGYTQYERECFVPITEAFIKIIKADDEIMDSKLIKRLSVGDGDEGCLYIDWKQNYDIRKLVKLKK